MTIQEFKDFIKTCDDIELGIFLGEAELKNSPEQIQALKDEFTERHPDYTFPEETP